MVSARKPVKCRVTGQIVATREGRGRPSEYLNDDARQFAFRMAQLGALLEKLAPEMDESTRRSGAASCGQCRTGLTGE